MATSLIYALVAAIIVGLIGWALAKPRSLAGRWLRRAWWWLFVRTSQERDEAISKHIDEIHYYSDWYRWFNGDPDANVDYSRKQERDLAHLRNGDFRIKQ